jgi:hypothetical protein
MTGQCVEAVTDGRMSETGVIDYESLMQEAHRSIVRTVLMRVAQTEKLPGAHYFYITFNTQAEGVGLSKRLRDQYPEEMTIVLQHRFWDLEVHDDRFEVKLTFSNLPERLVIPFKAIRVFFDPSVPYGLQLDDGPIAAKRQPKLAGTPGRSEPQRQQPLQGLPTSEPAEQSERPRLDGPAASSKPTAVKLQAVPDSEPPEAKPTAEIVKLDSFRKK